MGEEGQLDSWYESEDMLGSLQEIDAAQRCLIFKQKLVEMLASAVHLTVPTDASEVLATVNRSQDPSTIVQKLVQYLGMLGLSMPASVTATLRAGVNTRPMGTEPVGQGNTTTRRLGRPRIP